MEQSKKYKIMHSCEHVLAQAMKELYGDEYTPAVAHIHDEDSKFSNDALHQMKISEKDFPKIEKRMKKIIQRNLPITKEMVSIEKAKEMFENNKFKLEWIAKFEEEGEKEVSIYHTGDKYYDLCKGPHVEKTGEIKAFKLLSISGAYWKNDENNDMLTRIYGSAFESKEELEEHLHFLEMAEQRDHKKIAKEMNLYFIDEKVGKGLIMWLPRGNKVKDLIEEYAIEMEDKRDYERVTTPVIAKRELFEQSGHLPYYEKDMYPSMEIDNHSYFLKAMNCPHHHLIFNHTPKSYKEFPVRLAEYGRCHRYEKSGELSGLLRVSGMEMNDAHIYLRKDQIKDEMKNVLDLVIEYFDTFGFENYWFRLSKWDSNKTDKYVDEPENWDFTQNVIREVLEETEAEFIEADDEAAFYGPKIDVQFKSVLGREETMSTIQLDFMAKERFNLSYIDQNGEENNEVFVIHRAPLSVHERFLAFLIEHYAGAFPVWLHPEQVAIVPISDKHFEYAEKIKSEIKEVIPSARVKVLNEAERMQKRIRQAQVDKIPYMIIIGDKEMENESVNVRLRTEEELGEVSISDFVERLKGKIESKALDL